MQVLDSGTDWVGGGGGSTGTGGPKGGGGGNGSGGGAPIQWSDATTPETGNLQILLGEGQMEGLVDGLKSVYLDNTPVLASDGVTYNFKGLALALVAGTNTQPSIKGITGTESETSVNVQVTAASPVTRSVTSNPSAVRVRVSIPALRVVSTTDGKESAHSVTVKIERQNASWNAGAWEEVPIFNTGVVVGGPFSTKFTQSYRIDTPATGTWQIKVTRVSADDADAYHQSQTWWDALTEIVDVRLRRPNRAALAIRVNAKQFRSIPQVNLHMRGSRIQVPANYTPASFNWTTKVWTGAVYATTGPGTSGGAWDGTFKTVWSSNPAWCFYAAATNKLWGAGKFLNAGAIDKWALYSIGQFCDAMVADGKGGTEPQMTCNIYLQGQQNAIKALMQLASVFTGILHYASGLITPVPDADASPVALFTNANVEDDGRFNYEGTGRTARHTACIASFINPGLGYAQDAAYFECGPTETAILGYNPIDRYGYNVLDYSAIGATSQGQALRLAKWAVLSELMAPETVSFASGLMGSTVAPGNVIQCADQFRAGNTRMGGVVLAGSTTTVINLDAPVTIGAGTYTLRCQTPTGMESKTVTTGAGTVSALTVGSAFSAAPGEGTGWLLQAGTTASLWRVLSLKKGEGLKYEITALKHDPAKYVALGLAAGDVVTRTPRDVKAPAPAGLAISSVSRILNDRQQLTLNANWTLDGAVGYIAQASRDYGPWETMTVSGAAAYLDGIQPGSWRVRVAGDWRAAGVSIYTTVTATVTASGTVPTWIADAATTATAAGITGTLSASQLANGIISQAKMATGLQVPVIVTSLPALPNASYPIASIVTLTTDGKIYRNVANVWTAAVAAPDITGTIADAQIAGMAASKVTGTLTDAQIAGLAAAKLTGQIVGTQITDGSITTPKIGVGAITAASGIIADATIGTAKIIDGAITNAKIANLAVGTAQIADAAIVDAKIGNLDASKITTGYLAAARIAVDTINAGMIQAGAVGADEIAANAIYAKHLTVANFDNLCPNPNTTITTGPAGAYEIAGIVNSTGLGVGNASGWCRRLSASAPTFIRIASIPVVPGDKFYLQAAAAMAIGSNGSFYLLAQFVNTAGGYAVGSTDMIAGNIPYTSAPITLAITTIAAPSDAVLLNIYMCCGTISSGTQTAYYNNFYFRRMADANLIVDGAVTAQKIAANAITADKLLVTIGGSNLLRNSSFSALNAGAPDLWTIYNNTAGPEPATLAQIATGGVDGGPFARVSWSVNNTSTKGIYTGSGLAGVVAGTSGGLQGGWKANTGYVVSFAAKASGTNIGQTMDLRWNTAPASTTWISHPALSATWQKYSARLMTGASVEALGALYTTIATASGTNGTLDFDQVKIELGDVPGQWAPFIDEITPGTIVAAHLAAQSITADKLYSDMVISNTMRSANWSAGAAGVAPVGFRLDGAGRVITLLDGSSITGNIELGGSGSFGGYMVSTVTDRIQPVNRILNGYFYSDLNGWSASGANPPTYSASSVTAGTGSATLTYVGGFGYTKGGNLTQSFSLPKTFPGQTINLAYQTGYSGNGTNAGSDVCTIQVYILNQTTGTETLLATHSYSNANVAVAWTARSVNITSYVSAGGQFSIRFAMTLNDSHPAGSFTNSLYVDEVSVIA